MRVDADSTYRDLFQFLIFPAVLLHELSHWVIFKLFGIPSTIRVRYLNLDSGLSHVESARNDSATVALLVALAPPVLLVPAFLTSYLAGYVYADSAVGLILSAVLVVQGSGFLYASFPSELDILNVFAVAGSTRGRLAWVSLISNTALKLSAFLVWWQTTPELIPFIFRGSLVVYISIVLILSLLYVLWGLQTDSWQIVADPLYQIRAAMLLNQGRATEAEQLCHRTLEIESESVSAHNILAGVLLSEGRYHEAEHYCQRALELAPDHAETHATYAALLWRLDRTDEAIEHCQRALELDSEHGIAHTNYGGMLVEQGQNQKALPHCEKGVELQPENSVSYSNYAELLINQGNLEEAETYCQQAEKTEPEQPDIYTVKAALLCEQGNEKQAKREYEKALTVDPAYEKAHEAYAELLEKQGNDEKAQYHYDQATTQKTERVGKWVSPGSEHWYT